MRGAPPTSQGRGRRTALAALAALASLGLLPACPRPIEELELNQPPVARLVWPQLWPAGEPASFDPTLSEDPEGGPITFRIGFGDGSADAGGAGALGHVYAEPATFAVELVATDEEGRDARVQGSIVIVGDEREECSCELPCLDGALCVSGVCTRFASSLADEGTPALDGELSCP